MSNLTNIVYPNQESPLIGLGEQCVWKLQTLILSGSSLVTQMVKRLPAMQEGIVLKF